MRFLGDRIPRYAGAEEFVTASQSGIKQKEKSGQVSAEVPHTQSFSLPYSMTRLNQCNLLEGKK